MPNLYNILAQLSPDFQILAAPLNKSQKTTVNKWAKTAPEHTFSDHVMGKGRHRVSVKLRKPDIVAPKHIVEALGNAGHTEVNYAKGLVKDKYGRDMKIGRALMKAGHPELAKQYAADPQRATNPEHKIIISRHPHDVAGMSTNQGWTSCMNMKKKSQHVNHSHKLEHDVRHGTHVAYLVHKDDHEAKHPIARIAIKPHISETGHKILRPEAKTYGTSNSNFHKTVSAWTKKNFPAKDGAYEKHHALYDDDRNDPIKGPKFAEKFHNDMEFAHKYKHIASNKLLNSSIQRHTDPYSIANILHGTDPNRFSKTSIKHALSKSILATPGIKHNLLHSKHRSMTIMHERAVTGIKPSKIIPKTFPERENWYNSLTTKERAKYRDRLTRNGIRHTDNVDINKYK